MNAPRSVVMSASWAMMAFLVIAPELLGGVLPWSVAAIALMAGVAGTLASRGMVILSPRRRTAKLLDWMVVAALVWTGLQLLPLPVSWISFFVPESAAAWQSYAALYEETPRSWVPLSLDPGATRLELAKGSAIAAAYLTARVFAASGRRQRVLVAVGASATAMAVVAFVHRLAGAEAVFGIYEPVYASSRLLAPIMNENHLGGFMALGTPILLGLALDSDTLAHRIGWGVCAAVCAIAGVLSFSRGGILALGIGLVLFVGVYAVRIGRSDESLLRSRSLPMVGSAILGVTLIVGLLAGDALVKEFSYTHNRFAKLEAAKAALPVIATHPVTGVGRGAFSAAFVGEHGTAKRFFYPENILVQWTSEWGLIVCTPLLITIIWSLVRAFRVRRTQAHLGALAGLSAIAVHDLVDFSLEVTGIAVVAASALGGVADSVRLARVDFPLRSLCLLVSVSAFVGALVALTLHERDTFTLEQQITESLRSDDHSKVRHLVDEGLKLHPSEPILALTGADLAVRQQSESAGRWINRAQDLAPLWSAPHLLAARWLYGLGSLDQALVEIRRAESKSPGSARSTMCALLRDNPEAQIAVRAAPEGVDGAMFLDRAAQCIPLRSEAARAIDKVARQRDPTLAGPAVRQAKRRLAARDVQAAIDILAELPDLDLAGRVTLTNAYLRAGQLSAAEATIVPVLSRRRIPLTVLQTALSVYVPLRKDAEVRRVAARLRRQAGTKPRALADVDRLLGSLYEKDGQFARALKAYEAANRLEPERETLLAVARVSLALGKRDRAILVYRQLCRSDRGKGKACASARALASAPLTGSPP